MSSLAALERTLVRAAARQAERRRLRRRRVVVLLALAVPVVLAAAASVAATQLAFGGIFGGIDEFLPIMPGALPVEDTAA